MEGSGFEKFPKDSIQITFVDRLSVDGLAGVRGRYNINPSPQIQKNASHHHGHQK